MNINRQLILFTLLTWMISWPLWFLSGILTQGVNFRYDTQWLIAQIGAFAPSLSALVVSAFQSRDLRRNGLRILLLFIVILIGGMIVTAKIPRSIQNFTPGISRMVVLGGLLSVLFFSFWNRKLLVPGTGEAQGKAGIKLYLLAVLGIPFLFIFGWLLVNFQDHPWSVSTFKNGPVGFLAALTVAFFMNLNYGGSMGEELGWRGFALPLLLKKYSPIQASLLLGLIWAIWHLPIDLSSSDLSPAGAVLLRFVWVMPVSIIFTWFYLNSGGNILIAILLHTSINVLPDLGFSGYERSILFLTLALIVTAAAVSSSRQMKRGNVVSPNHL